MDWNETSCCGVLELEGIRDTPVKDFLHEFFDDRKWGYKQKVVIFTDAKPPKTRDKTHGDKVADRIVAQRLGQVIRSKFTLNPNSGNYVRVFVWSLNKKAEQMFEEQTGGFE